MSRRYTTFDFDVDAFVFATIDSFCMTYLYDIYLLVPIGASVLTIVLS